MASLRHEFYETDEKLTISVFDRGADPAQVSITFEPRKISYQNGEKTLSLQPLKGQIDPERCDFTVGKVKVELRLAKMAQGRWGAVTGDALDPLQTSAPIGPTTSPAVTEARAKPKKNWEELTTKILTSEKEATADEDPNVGGDSTVNSFFQKIFGDADDDAKRAMMKSFQESGGTTLSTNWEEVSKAPVEVKPPAGSEWKKWD
ncbi:SGS-domain-containing protein [Suillus clintonianus]|uniref:SGS-domain-containing protein n=1 Tax=Suillus clintonianus TaxID=1904413 RepID=UPI001B87068E|nr:SGS-domain-containing protein [Suillus clintonianus]KAG2154821.1 SGS-domain-containing protein [Suillus clintonianus]